VLKSKRLQILGPAQSVTETLNLESSRAEGTDFQELPYGATINDHKIKRRALYASIVAENVRLRHLNYQLRRDLGKFEDIKMDNIRLQENSGQVLKANNTLASVMADCPRCTHVLGLVTYLQSSLPPPVMSPVSVAAQRSEARRPTSAWASDAGRMATDLVESSTLSNYPDPALVASTSWLPVDPLEKASDRPRSATVMVLDQVQSDGEDFLTID